MGIRLDIFATTDVLRPIEAQPLIGLECRNLILPEPVGAISIDATRTSADTSIELLQARSAEVATECLVNLFPPSMPIKALWVKLDVPRPNHHLHIRRGFWHWLEQEKRDLFIDSAPFGPDVEKAEESHHFDCAPTQSGEDGARLAFVGYARYQRSEFGRAMMGLFEFGNYLRQSPSCCFAMRDDDEFTSDERIALATAMWRAENTVVGALDHCLVLQRILRRDRVLFTAMYDHGWHIARIVAFGLSSQLLPERSLPLPNIAFVNAKRST